MSKLRSVNTHFWSDNYIIELDPDMKLLFLYLLTNEHTNMLGIYEMHRRRIAFDTGIDADTIRSFFEKLEDAGKGCYVEGHIVLYNFMKNQRMNENMKKSAVATFKELPDKIKKHPSAERIRKELGVIGDEIKNIVVPMSRREAMFVKYRGVCQYCKEEIKHSHKLEADHVVPLSKAGSDTYDNLVLSCRTCNQSKLDRTPKELGWEHPTTGGYHLNSARKDLLEIEWLRKRFNEAFNRKLRVTGGKLTEVNHKHILNKDKGKGKLESEVEYEEETKPSLSRAGASEAGQEEKPDPPDTDDSQVRGCPIPEALQIENFTERYEEFCGYLETEKKQTISIQRVESQFRRLIELKNKGNPPLEVMDQTIRSGNKDLYPLKDKTFNQKNDGKTKKHTRHSESRADRYFDIAEGAIAQFPSEDAEHYPVEEPG